MLLKISCFCATYKSSVSTGFTEQIMHILRILCYNGSLVIWTVVGLIIAKFKPLIFSMSGFTLSYTANMFILMILYDFNLFPAHCQSQSQSQSQSYFTTGGLPPNSSSWRQAPWDPRPDLFFQLNSCGNCPYVTSSLTRRWVYTSQYSYRRYCLPCRTLQ
jgi:hypothetical protein